MSAGILFESQRGDQMGPALYTLIQQVFLFSNGILAGLLSTTEPGTTWAWLGLSSILLLKAACAIVVTVLQPHLDILDTIGEICTAWLSVASCICMLALQPYYTKVWCSRGPPLAMLLETTLWIVYNGDPF